MLLGHPIESSETRKYRMLGKDKTTTKKQDGYKERKFS